VAATIVNGSGVFTVTIDLTSGNASTNPPTSANPYVVTLCDTGGGNEMANPVLVPLVSSGTPTTTGAVPQPTITVPSAGAKTSNNFFDVQGTVPVSTVGMLIQIWPASGASKLAGSSPLTNFFVTPGLTGFTLHTPLITTGANQFVVSATAQSTPAQESAVVPVPTITTSSTTITPLPPPTPTPTPTPVPSPGPISGSESVETIQGIGPVTTAALQKHKIHTLQQLLDATTTTAKRKNLAAALKPDITVTDSIVNGWRNQADLAITAGIGPQYSELLAAAGINSRKELKQRNAGNLAATLADVNEGRTPPFVSRPPSQKIIASWQAKL